MIAASCPTRRERAEPDAPPVTGAQQRLLYGDRLAHPVGEHRQPRHTERLQTRQHLTGDVAAQHRLLQGVAVDEHRGGQRLEARDPEGVEDARPDPGEISLPTGDVPHDLQLEVRGVRAPFVRDLDAQSTARDLGDPVDEVRNSRLVVEVCVPVGQRQHDRLARPASLVPVGACRAADKGDRSA